MRQKIFFSELASSVSSVLAALKCSFVAVNPYETEWRE
jgi:hypothetical protein